MNTFKLTLLAIEINHIYEQLKQHYVGQINPDKKPYQVGGTYYGRAQLFATVGTQFKKVVGYTHHEYAGKAYYDFAFEVGGAHSSDFLAFKEAFVSECKEELEACLTRHGFVQDNRFFVHEDIRILFVEDVGYGTNFSTYCGICIYIKDKDLYREQRLSKQWLSRTIQ